MKLTYDKLEEILLDPEFRAHPIKLVEDNPEIKTWLDFSSELVNQGARASMWEAGMLVGCLFDTYGSVIKSVNIDLTLDQDDNLYLSNHVYVNGCRSSSSYPLAIGQDMDMCVAIDEARVIKQIVGRLESIFHENLLGQMMEIKSYLSGGFSSAGQARSWAQEVAPETDSLAKVMLLSRVAQTSQATRARGGREMKL